MSVVFVIVVIVVVVFVVFVVDVVVVVVVVVIVSTWNKNENRLLIHDQQRMKKKDVKHLPRNTEMQNLVPSTKSHRFVLKMRC